jgi:polyisoprenoid-binding protein YceI
VSRIGKLLFVLVILGFAGRCLAADEYVIDKGHSRVAFTVKHLVINKVTGIFHDFSGTIQFDEKDVTKSSINGAIKVSTVDTNNENRDNDLRTSDGLFEAAKFPEITFQSKKIVKKGDGYVCTGTLTIHGVPKDIDLVATVSGPIKDLGGNSRIGVEATGTINRQDFGLTWSHAIEGVGLIASDEVTITINAEGVKKASNTK